MLYITATNFGVSPFTPQIRAYYENNLLVLSGTITVDTTAEEYAGIRPMQITFDDLPFAKSRVSTAIVTVESDGVKYATVTKVWVSDKNTINIAKVMPYKSAGSYKVHFSTVLIPEKITGEIALAAKKTYVPEFIKGSGEGVEVYTVETANWLMLTFKASSLAFDAEDETVEMRLPDFPENVSAQIPVFYNEGLWVALGSKYYPASLAKGILTIRKDGNADEASNTGNKFTRIVVVRLDMSWDEGWCD